jgi:hypothetical protein
MTYQFPATAWRPTKKAGSTPTAPLDQGELAATIADALIAPARGIYRRPSPRSAMEMLAQLEDQARELMELAQAAEGIAPFRTFTAYRVFRERLSDFQTFCGVIEGQLGRIAANRRPELEERFYALWGAIYRPAVKALGNFFAIIERDGVMPLGAREMLEAEMLALEGMRSFVIDPRFQSHKNDDLIAELVRLVKLVGGLADRASSLPELVDTRPTTRPKGRRAA